MRVIVDETGRVMLPAAIRSILAIQEWDELDIRLEGRDIVLQKPADTCVFCRRTHKLVRLRHFAVCEECRLLLADAEGGDRLYTGGR